MILERRGNDRQTEFAVLREEQDVIFFDGIFNRTALLFPVGHQIIDAAGVHDGARNDMRADLFPFFENRDRKILV